MRSIWTEAQLLGLSILTGLCLMALYDGLRIFRMLVRHGFFWIGLEDIGYWLVCALTVFYLLYRENDGIIRWYAVGCVFLTMLIYDHCISIFLLKGLKKVVRCFKINTLRRHKKSGRE